MGNRSIDRALQADADKERDLLLARIAQEVKDYEDLREFGSTEMEEYHYHDGVVDGLQMALVFIRGEGDSL